MMSATSRSYVSPVRAAAAAEKRRLMIDAATRFLREEGSIANFSLEAIAREAGVARLTLYNQFGSRSGLLEAIFEDIARRGKLARLADVTTDPDPWRGLDRFIEIFCEFWSFEPAVGRLQDAVAIDREFGQAVLDRTERRRPTIQSIVRRLHPGQSARLERDMVDLIFSLTAYASFQSLSIGRKPGAVCTLLKRACRDVARAPDDGRA
ncbi:MAG: transcriptional regulatory protein [Bradyrhizobium sp.]|nr:transcriptional regulatory protein [Bradyrhizobium sp.]